MEWKNVAAPLALLAASGIASADEAERYAEAEAAILGFRAVSYLPTPCESAFRSFWKEFRADGVEGLVHETPGRGARRYFGYGNPGSEAALAHAGAVCRHQTGAADSLVLHVLRDREQAKESRLRYIRHAERIIAGH